MSKDAPTPPPIENWQAQNFRLIVFPEDPNAAFARDWWKELIGTDPDSSTRTKIEREDAGIYAGDLLIASINPARIQWTVTRAAEPESIIDGVPLLGKFTEKKEAFVSLMARWFPSCPSVKRIGFVVSLLQEATQRDEAYKLLNSYLRYVEVHPDSSDLMYRVNRRRPSKSGPSGLWINALATWSAVKIIASLSVLAGQDKPAEMDKVTKNYCALELDINTNPEFSGPIPTERLPDILQELANIATDIAIRGDVRVD